MIPVELMGLQVEVEETGEPMSAAEIDEAIEEFTTFLDDLDPADFEDSP